MKISYESRIIKMFGPPGFKHVKHEDASLALSVQNHCCHSFAHIFLKCLCLIGHLGRHGLKFVHQYKIFIIQFL